MPAGRDGNDPLPDRCVGTRNAAAMVTPPLLIHLTLSSDESEELHALRIEANSRDQCIPLSRLELSRRTWGFPRQAQPLHSVGRGGSGTSSVRIAESHETNARCERLRIGGTRLPLL